MIADGREPEHRDAGRADTSGGGDDHASTRPSERELRAEIDALRLQIQHLNVELARAAAVRHVLAGATADWRLRLRARLVGATRRLLRGPRVGSDAQAYGDGFSPDFRPYRVRILQPARASRPRVLHVIGNLLTGGSAQLVVDLVERLGHRYEQPIVTKILPSPPAYVGLDIRHCPSFRAPREPLDLLRRLRPDLVHVHYLFNTRSPHGWRWYNAVFQAAEAYGVPVIENVNIPVPPYVSVAVRRYVYVSDFVRCRFGRLDAPNLTIYPGSDFGLFARRDGSAPPDDTLGMIYRLDPGKLSERSIDPFIEALRRREGTRALIVGGGSYLALYRGMARAAGVADAMTFTGYVAFTDLPAHIERMSVYVAPVEVESFGQVVPFAMSMGLPVAAYDVGALSEILGSRETLVPPGDSRGLADIALALLDDRDRRRALGERNRERARRLFSVETMAERYDRLYEEVLAGR